MIVGNLFHETKSTANVCGRGWHRKILDITKIPRKGLNGININRATDMWKLAKSMLLRAKQTFFFFGGGDPRKQPTCIRRSNVNHYNCMSRSVM